MRTSRQKGRPAYHEYNNRIQSSTAWWVSRLREYRVASTLTGADCNQEIGIAAVGDDGGEDGAEDGQGAENHREGGGVRTFRSLIRKT